MNLLVKLSKEMAEALFGCLKNKLKKLKNYTFISNRNYALKKDNDFKY